MRDCSRIESRAILSTKKSVTRSNRNRSNLRHTKKFREDRIVGDAMCMNVNFKGFVTSINSLVVPHVSYIVSIFDHFYQFFRAKNCSV